MLNRLCLICSKEFSVKKRSSRVLHCSGDCARITQRRKVSISLKAFYKKHPEKIRRGTDYASHIGEKIKRKSRSKGVRATKYSSILEFSSRTVQKIIKRLNLGCSNCGWKEAACDIHHINGRKIQNANEHKNLSLLCPNCHRLAHKGKLRKEDLKNLEEIFPDNWTEKYYA